jgi:hypothetical protein
MAATAACLNTIMILVHVPLPSLMCVLHEMIFPSCRIMRWRARHLRRHGIMPDSLLLDASTVLYRGILFYASIQIALACHCVDESTRTHICQPFPRACPRLFSCAGARVLHMHNFDAAAVSSIKRYQRAAHPATLNDLAGGGIRAGVASRGASTTQPCSGCTQQQQRHIERPCAVSAVACSGPTRAVFQQSRLMQTLHTCMSNHLQCGEGLHGAQQACTRAASCRGGCASLHQCALGGCPAATGPGIHTGVCPYALHNDARGAGAA